MLETLGPTTKKRGKKLAFQEIFVKCFQGMSRTRGVEGDSVAQKRVPASSPDAVGVNKKTSTPSTSDRITKTKTTNLNPAQGKTVDVLCTYVIFDEVWNTFAQQKVVSMQFRLVRNSSIQVIYRTLLDQRFKKFNMCPTRKYVEKSQQYTQCME